MQQIETWEEWDLHFDVKRARGAIARVKNNRDESWKERVRHRLPDIPKTRAYATPKELVILGQVAYEAAHRAMFPRERKKGT